MIRPVQYLPLSRPDFVGPLEQPYMAIACTQNDIRSGHTTHLEHVPTNVLSILANQTPFSDFNQSPRNMYQCQMSKQSMGTPGTALRYRTDNKTYRLQTGQTPVVRPPLYNEYGLDNYPNGMNAIVAVISYTGYDMDDAMIINKSSHERGFGDGVIYKTKFYDLAEKNPGTRRQNTDIKALFGFEVLTDHRDFAAAIAVSSTPWHINVMTYAPMYVGDYSDELLTRFVGPYWKPGVLSLKHVAGVELEFHLWIKRFLLLLRKRF